MFKQPNDPGEMGYLAVLWPQICHFDVKFWRFVAFVPKFLIKMIV